MAIFSPELASEGLNLQAVMSLENLPRDILNTLQDAQDDTGDFRQLLLVGHGGRRLWEAISAQGASADHLVDDFTVSCIREWFRKSQPRARYRILYPGGHLVPLQSLGKLCGWHFPSPIMVGVNSEWGSWYAYRAVLLADTDFAETARPEWHSACEPCGDKPCISACPAGAVSTEGLDIPACTAYRKQPDSPCQYRCLARLACPVGSEHRYTEAQIEYHYGRSFETINKYY